MSELAIGIDLGTSNSCVAIARGGEVRVLANAFGERITASVVAFQQDGLVEVGNRARANIIHDPENTLCSAKRLIGRYYFSEEVKKAQAVYAYEIVEGPNHGVRVMARDEEFSLPEISAMVLREMKQVAEAALGETVTKAVITVPAYFNDNQRQATKDAGKIAGLEVLRILNEPTAAALAYGFGRSLDQRVAVYDLGGGTFDVSVLEIGKDIFEVLSTCGDTFLGGDDFDDRLIDLLADEFVAKEGINLRGDPYAFEKIKVAAEDAKRALSCDDETVIRIPDILTNDDGTSLSIERTITQTEYNALVQDLVMRTFKVCDEAMQQAELTTRDLDGVILVGGPTRLPLIRQAVADYFQQELKDEVDPDEVVAKGAAIHAASLVSPEASREAFLLDVTPLDLRIGVAGGLAEPVIEANTPVPIEQTRRFTTTRDYQESVQLRVYQGASRQSEENELLGQFEFAGFDKVRRGDVAIDVTFEINADGIVNVSAFDPESGQRASTAITLSSGLSAAELEVILEQDHATRSPAPQSGGAAEAPSPTPATQAKDADDANSRSGADPLAAATPEAIEFESVDDLGEASDLSESLPLMPDHAALKIDTPAMPEEFQVSPSTVKASERSQPIADAPAAPPTTAPIPEPCEDLEIGDDDSAALELELDPADLDDERALDDELSAEELSALEAPTLASPQLAETTPRFPQQPGSRAAETNPEPTAPPEETITAVELDPSASAPPAAAPQVDDIWAAPIETEPSSAEDLFDTDNVDLSADLEPE